MIGSTSIGVYPIGSLADGEGFVQTYATQYFSVGGYTTAPTDSPASVWHDERVIQPLEFLRSIASARFGGLANEQAEIVLANMDAALDGFPTSFAVDNRRVTVRVGEPDFRFADFGVVFDGVMRSMDLTENEASISVSTKRYALDALIQTTTYAGTGGNEGGADLAGQVKPLCFGKCFNVPAVLVNSVGLVYQVHDGRINGVPAVYDRGIALTLTTGIPSAGQYAVDAAGGRFTLGATPAGQITADVEGRHDGTYWLTRVADIVADIVANYSPLSSSDYDAASVAALNAAQPARVGIFISDAETCADVLDELLIGMGCFGYFSMQSKLIVGQLAAPALVESFELTEDDIIAASRSALPSDLAPLAWRWRVTYARNYTVQNDLAAGVPSARKDFAALPNRVSYAGNVATLATFPLATDPSPQISLMTTKADADAEAARMFAIFGVRRWIYTISAKPALWLAEIGQTVLLTYPRHGLNAGLRGVIVGIRLDAQDNQTELVVLA